MRLLFLGQNSVPYLAIILLGWCGTGILHMADRLTESPTLEYCVRWSEKSQRSSVIVNIENLSHKKRFQGLEFNLGSRSKNGGKFSKAKITGIPPAFKKGKNVETDGQSLKFEIPDIQPRARYQITARYRGNDKPPIRLMSAQSEVLLLECSLLTFLLKHQFGFIILFSMISMCFIIFILYMRHKISREESHV